MMSFQILFLRPTQEEYTLTVDTQILMGGTLFDGVFDGEFNGDSHDFHWALRIITKCKNVLKIMKL